jgi:hypothetical protein
MPLRINLEMVVSWVKFFFSQTMEEKLSFGSSFKKHSFINTNFGLANEEAVNDHRLLHRATISFKRRCNVRAATSWRSPYDLLLWDDGFCAQESLLKFVHFWCNPKLRTREEKYEFKNVHLPSKKSPVVGRSQAGTAGAHT